MLIPEREVRPAAKVREGTKDKYQVVAVFRAYFGPGLSFENLVLVHAAGFGFGFYRHALFFPCKWSGDGAKIKHTRGVHLCVHAPKGREEESRQRHSIYSSFIPTSLSVRYPIVPSTLPQTCPSLVRPFFPLSYPSVLLAVFSLPPYLLPPIIYGLGWGRLATILRTCRSPLEFDNQGTAFYVFVWAVGH